VAELGGRATAGVERVSLRRLIALPNELTLRTQVIVGSLAVAVVVTATYILLLVAMSDLQRSTNAQARSRDVTAATLGLERVVNQLDLSLRGFIITDNERLLLTWNQAHTALGPAISSQEN
jgi:CHASE3 domain sensor protein